MAENREMARKSTSFFSSLSLKSGTETVSKGGSLWRAMFALVRSTMFAFSEQANLRFRLAERGFLGSFFAAWQRMNIKSRYRSARDEIAQYDRQQEKV